MAGRTGDGEKAAWYRRLGELGMEAGLGEAGFPKEIIVSILGHVNAASTRMDQQFWQSGIMHHLSDIEGGRSVFLALLGRSVSPLEEVNLSVVSAGDLHENDAIALAANLSSHSNVQSLNLLNQMVFGSQWGCTLLGNALRSNSVLKTLKFSAVGMTSEGAKCLLDGLQGNSTLEELDISDNDILQEGARYVAEMLCSNTTLKRIDIRGITSSDFRGAEFEHMGYALEHNTTLETLDIGFNHITSDGMERLLAPLSGNPNSGNPNSGPENTTLKSLNLANLTIKGSIIISLAWLIKTNKSLSSLNLRFTYWETEDWVDLIIPALRKNDTLKKLDLSNCKGLNEERGYDALMDLLQSSNTGLEEIKLDRTGMATRAGQVNEELRANKEYRAKLRGQTLVQPKSGRLVLCGFEFAGKTTIRETMQCGYEFAGKTTIRETMQRIVQGNSESCSHVFNLGLKKLMRALPGVRRLFFGVDAHKEFASRTRGFDIVLLRKEPKRTSIWDFAGQKEYYALHDYLFPEVKNSCFLYVCSCRRPPDHQNAKGNVTDKGSMKRELHYWLRFIASNAKPREVGGNRISQLPRVTFVLTNKDTLDVASLNECKQWARDVVLELMEEFQDLIDLSDNLEVVDARSAEDVKRLLTVVDDNFTDLLKHKTEYAVCEEVRGALERWSNDHKLEPLSSWDQFTSLCRQQVKTYAPRKFREAQLQSVEGQNAVLAYLNDVGDIIYVKGLDFIVVNPRWFGIGILGCLIDAFGRTGDRSGQWAWKKYGICGGRRKPLWNLVHEQGFVTKKNVKDLLEHSLQTMHLKQVIPPDKLIQLMMYLGMCFEKEPGNPSSTLFVPALFDDDTESASKGFRQLYWKLKRPDGKLVFIGRRLQCSNELTCLTPGFFPRLQVHLRNYIHGKTWTRNRGFEVGRNMICFCENGIEVFVEYSGDIDYFIDILVKSPKSYAETLLFIEEHVVKIIIDLCASPQGCQGVLLIQAVIRPVCVKDLHICFDRKPHSVLVSALKRHIEIGLDYGYLHTWSEGIVNCSDTDFALDLLKGEGSYNSYLGSSSTASSSILRNTEMSSQYQQLPKLFYPTIEDVGMLRRLEAHMNLAKVIPIKIHLMCHHKDGSHKVEGQPGRIVKLNSKEGQSKSPILKYAIKLLWAGVNVGANSAGLSPFVPNIDNEVEKVFNVPEMNVTSQWVVKMMSQGKPTGRPIADQEILSCLEEFMQRYPYSQWLQSFLNLQDGVKFFADFQLCKVMYTNAVGLENNIGWLCQGHFDSGLEQNIIQPVPH